MKHQIYLDYAAATPVDERVLRAMKPYFSDQFYNASAAYLGGRAAKNSLSEARASIAKWLGARPAEIVFTAGATEANNLAIQGVMRRFPKAEMIISSIEHESVLAPARLFKHREIPATQQGLIDLTALEKMITPKTVLISVMYVNNELGTIQPLNEIAQLVQKMRQARLKTKNQLPLYLHSDAAQAANFLDLHVSRLGVDLMSLNGGKIYGPKQAGALFVRAGLELQPLILGGGQEGGLRSGTENIAAATGLAEALDIAQSMRKSESTRLQELRTLLVQELAKIPSTTLNGSAKHHAPHIVHATFAGVDNERLMMELDEKGIICAVGSACSASREEASHVLNAIGLNDELARASLRFSMGRGTTKAQILRTIKILRQLLLSHR